MICITYAANLSKGPPTSWTSPSSCSFTRFHCGKEDRTEEHSLYHSIRLFPHVLSQFHCFWGRSKLFGSDCRFLTLIVSWSCLLWLWDRQVCMLIWSYRRVRIWRCLPSFWICWYPVWIDEKLPVLVIVDDLEGVKVNCHYSVLWMFVAVSGETGGNEKVVYHVCDVFDAWEEANVISVTVSVKLSSYYVGVSVCESVKSHWPLIQGTFGRDVTNDPNELTFFLWLLEFSFNPLKHFSSISRVSYQIPVHIVLSLSVHWNYLQVVELWEGNTEISFCS